MPLSTYIVNAMLSIEKRLLQTSAEKHWKKIGIRHHHGINIPLFSLHSQTGSGIGEFMDLLPLIPWCQKIGLNIIQLLPLNDTGKDTSPYGAISAFALNPIYLSLAHLPFLERFPDLQEILKGINSHPFTQRIDYTGVSQNKENFLRAYFQKAAPLIIPGLEYSQFIQENAFWLKGFVLFKSLKTAHSWEPWEKWEPELQNPSEDAYENLFKKFEPEINYHSIIQYLCFQQLRKVKAYANTHGVLLKGDIPILINRDSADVWQHRSLFQMEYSAGAPPDMYSQEGQNWGFPIYNWEELEKQDYHWWKLRLKVASLFYDIYRIDHIVGFFRIWAIPLGLPGKEGKFTPENQALSIPQGTKILQMMLESSPMLPIGEDLGTVPPEIRVAMRSLGICGTAVMRWERFWNEDKRFLKPNDYQVESMTTVSTHDSETLAVWWESFPEDAREYSRGKDWVFTYELDKKHQYEILWDSHHTASLFHINLLNEYLALIPGMTWFDSIDERINIPGVVSPRNWTYRFKPSVEEIVSHEALYLLLCSLIS